jgi:hypothetical protein
MSFTHGYVPLAWSRTKGTKITKLNKIEKNVWICRAYLGTIWTSTSPLAAVAPVLSASAAPPPASAFRVSSCTQQHLLKQSSKSRRNESVDVDAAAHASERHNHNETVETGAAHGIVNTDTSGKHGNDNAPPNNSANDPYDDAPAVANGIST